MFRLLAYACLSLALPLPAWAQQSEANPSSSPDGAIITYRRSEPLYGKAPEETWHKLGNTVRIDTRPSDGRDLVDQNFTRPGQTVLFQLGRSGDGRPQYLGVHTGWTDALPLPAARTFTGATEEHLGKLCRVWRVVRRTDTGFEFVRSGCVADDGIELWVRAGDVSTITATAITYRSVAASDVRPPFELLDVRAWMPEDGDDDHAHDYRVDLGADHGLLRTHTQTRSGAWLATRTQSWSGGEGHALVNGAIGFEWRYSLGQDNRRHLYIHRRDIEASSARTDMHEERYDSKPDEVVLRERCRWWDTMAGGVDGGRMECRTNDGIPLIITESVISTTLSNAVAERLSRSVQPLSAVMPDEQLHDPALWGF